MATYTSQYPAGYSTTYVKATSEGYGTDYSAWRATDPSKSLTGTYQNNSWLTNASTNQRFHIDLGSGKIIRRIYYENQLTTGGAQTNLGIRNVTFWGSNDSGAFSTLTYGTDTNWTQLTLSDSEFDQHTAADTADPKYSLVTNSTEYRYYAIKIADNWGDGSSIGVRRIELQTEDGYTPGGTTNASFLLNFV